MIKNFSILFPKNILLMVLLALAVVPKTSLAQQSFNLNNVLVMSKEGTKRVSVLRTGQMVKCRLKGGEKVRGELYVYPDSIVIENQGVEFDEIEMIKPVSFKVITAQLGGLAFNEVARRQSGADMRSGYWIRNGLFTALNFTLLNKKIKTVKGWEFKIQEMPALNFRGRR